MWFKRAPQLGYLVDDGNRRGANISLILDIAWFKIGRLLNVEDKPPFRDARCAAGEAKAGDGS